MSITLLKHNAEILVEVSQRYESLRARKINLKGQDLVKVNAELVVLKNQALFLLAGIKKEAEGEKNAF